MSRFLPQSSRRLFAVAALVTATAVPSVLIVSQSAAGAKTNGINAKPATTTVATMAPDGIHMH